MPQNPSDIKAARDAAGKYGRINWGEYSKMTGTPIPKNAVPATVKPSQGELKARANAKRLGRINVSEYRAINSKQPRRKAAPRKRVTAK